MVYVCDLCLVGGALGYFVSVYGCACWLWFSGSLWGVVVLVVGFVPLVLFGWFLFGELLVSG